ncbi:MAG: hypothetical protein ACMXX9_02995 [Candidatus Woesearchaeota archaeon]
MEHFKRHYGAVHAEAKQRLSEFKSKKDLEHEELFEELAFCVFAANSSAKMGLLAVELLKPVLHNGELNHYKEAVHKKVRFYNVRSKYLYYNKDFIEKNHGSLREMLNKFEDKHELRYYIKENLKGFGMKESSHFLRNIGYSGFAIIDKHVLNVLEELGVREAKPPRNVKEYLEIEKEIIEFANKHGFDVDVLDLAFWSYKTGEIIK